MFGLIDLFTKSGSRDPVFSQHETVGAGVWLRGYRLVGIPASYTRRPGCALCLHVLTLSPHQFRLWEATVMAQVAGFLPSMWETWTEFLAPYSGHDGHAE